MWDWLIIWCGMLRSSQHCGIWGESLTSFDCYFGLISPTWDNKELPSPSDPFFCQQTPHHCIATCSGLVPCCRQHSFNGCLLISRLKAWDMIENVVKWCLWWWRTNKLFLNISTAPSIFSFFFQIILGLIAYRYKWVCFNLGPIEAIQIINK